MTAEGRPDRPRGEGIAAPPQAAPPARAGLRRLAVRVVRGLVLGGTGALYLLGLSASRSFHFGPSLDVWPDLTGMLFVLFPWVVLAVLGLKRRRAAWLLAVWLVLPPIGVEAFASSQEAWFRWRFEDLPRTAAPVKEVRWWPLSRAALCYDPAYRHWWAKRAPCCCESPVNP